MMFNNNRVFNSASVSKHPSCDLAVALFLTVKVAPKAPEKLLVVSGTGATERKALTKTALILFCCSHVLFAFTCTALVVSATLHPPGSSLLCCIFLLSLCDMMRETVPCNSRPAN